MLHIERVGLSMVGRGTEIYTIQSVSVYSKKNTLLLPIDMSLFSLTLPYSEFPLYIAGRVRISL